MWLRLLEVGKCCVGRSTLFDASDNSVSGVPFFHNGSMVLRFQRVVPLLHLYWPGWLLGSGGCSEF